MIPDPNELFPKLDADGEEAVREKLAQGVYGERRTPLVKEWLERKARERKAAEKERHEARDGRKVDLAAEANAIARAASVTATMAYRISALSVIVAVVALIVAAVTQCTGRI